MKTKFFWFAVLITLVNHMFSQQEKIIVKKNQHQFFNQIVTFNPSIEKYYRVLECKLNGCYTKEQLRTIQSSLLKNFSEAKVVQSDNELKVLFITNKVALVKNNGSIQEYIKYLLVDLNLYRGFSEIKEYNLELQ